MNRLVFAIILKFVVLFLSFSQDLALANVVGADTQLFNTTTNGLDFVTVHSSETLQPGVFNFGFFINAAGNTLPNYENANNQSLSNLKDTLYSGDINLGVGISRGWDVGISFPQVYGQTVENDAFRGEFESTGLTEVRLNTKVRLFGDQSGGIAVVGSINFNQIENNTIIC